MVKIKFLLLIIFLMMSSIIAKCQTDSVSYYNYDLTFSLESWPVYKGGQKALQNMIVSNLVYPESAKKDVVEGRVYVQFWVDTDGNTSEHKIIKGIREDLDEEAIRVSKLIKFEKPAIQQGKPIKVSYTVPVVFKLNDTKEKSKGFVKGKYR